MLNSFWERCVCVMFCISLACLLQEGSSPPHKTPLPNPSKSLPAAPHLAQHLLLCAPWQPTTTPPLAQHASLTLPAPATNPTTSYYIRHKRTSQRIICKPLHLPPDHKAFAWLTNLLQDRRKG